MPNTFKRSTARNIGLTANTVYTVPSSTTTVVIGMTVSNKTLISATTDIIHHDGTNSTFILNDGPVEPGGTIVVAGGDQKIVLATGDSLRVSSSNASSLDVVLSYMEIT